MVWVKSEYADELAVVVTWLSMVLPWSVAYTAGGPLGSHLAFVRISLFELQLRFPSEITFDGVPLDVAAALDVVYSGFQIAGNFYGTFPPCSTTARPSSTPARSPSPTRSGRSVRSACSSRSS
jgi:hypothetical protein